MADDAGPEMGRSNERHRTTLRLPPLLDLAAAEALCSSLRDAILAGGTLLIEADQVERVSTPCMQVLLAAARGARSRGLPLHLHNPSPALAEALADLGLAAAFSP